MEDAADDLRAAVAARRELGPDFEPEIVESFLERLDHAIEARVDAQVGARLAEAAEPAREGTPAEVVFASMLGGLLATGVIGLTLDNHETALVFLVWIIVAAVNLAPAVGRRRPSR
ncbi:hypothetical protein [Spirillospora sp. CA-294931]|uniref:hypothetical protein n=1 Tax=Spirillospora sp. CA-294931 TaxID=3240042 RepID=UPI003D94B751